MKSKKKGLFADLNPREARGLVGELRPGDGIDPRDEAKHQRRERRADRPGQGHGIHKQEQFLSQVHAAIESALQTAASPVLSRLSVQEVAPQGGSLVVVLSSDCRLHGRPQLSGSWLGRGALAMFQFARSRAIDVAH